MKKLLFIFLIIFFTKPAICQETSDLGAWYMYFGNLRFTDSPWAIHGEAQYRNHHILRNTEQLLIRTGLQYHLKNGSTSFLAGYGSVTTHSELEPKTSFHENRSYQEIILRQKTGRIGLTHRYRYEQRWIENQDFRTRFRYALFVNVPLNSIELGEKASWYVQGYNELFINGEKLDGKVQYFDRNRWYLGIGYRVVKNMSFQLGVLEQKTDKLSKMYLQTSVFHQLFSK
jgi:hypothetical protein